MDEIMLGSLGLSVFLNIFLRLLYNTLPIGNRVKPWIAIFLGMGMGMLGMYYNVDVITKRVVIDYLIGGFMAGATAVGLYEISQFKSKS